MDDLRFGLKLLHDPCDLLDMVLRESPDAAAALLERAGRRRVADEARRSCLDWGYLAETLELMGEPAAEPPAPQAETDACLATLADACHATLLRLSASDPARSWLGARGVTQAQIERHRIGVFGGAEPREIAPLLAAHPPGAAAAVLSWKPLFGLSGMARARGLRHMTYIVVPEVEGGELQNLCLRALGEPLISKFFFSHGRKMTFNRAHGQSEALLVEGVFDALALERAGIGNAVGLGSSRLTPGHMRRLGRFSRLTLALDGDDAGIEGMRRAAREHGVGRFVLVPGGLDPDDYLRAGGDPSIFLSPTAGVP